ncbi:MAG: hypothetical protein ACXAC5_01850 [Promethearchaeota archaeon]|jgi:hypothetical protein
MNESNELLPFVKPETIAAIQADPFAMQALEATRDFLYLAHRDFSRLTEDGKMIFNEDEAGIAWAALGELMAAGPDDLPSDSYKLVARMTGKQLLRELQHPRKTGIRTIVVAEIEMRLDGMQRS